LLPLPDVLPRGAAHAPPMFRYYLATPALPPFQLFLLAFRPIFFHFTPFSFLRRCLFRSIAKPRLTPRYFDCRLSYVLMLFIFFTPRRLLMPARRLSPPPRHAAIRYASPPASAAALPRRLATLSFFAMLRLAIDAADCFHYLFYDIFLDAGWLPAPRCRHAD
jgi:hypothetical protein